MKIVITGACGDLGSAISRKLFDCGAHLVLWDIDKEGLNRISNDLGDACHVDQVDITDPDSVSIASEYVETKFGGLDILINNAGILPPYGPTWALTPEQFRKVHDVNLMGAFLCIRAFVPQLQRSQKNHGKARIINMASYLGCEPQGFDSAYASSKAGLIALTKSLAKELASEGILVNCVAPTVVESRMGKAVPPDVLEEKLRQIPLGRFARPNEIAAMVEWLCSSECSFSTGAVFNLSGGRGGN